MKVDKKIPLGIKLYKRIMLYGIALTFVMGIFFISSIPYAHAAQTQPIALGVGCPYIS